jgi:hypothetical protein
MTDEQSYSSSTPSWTSWSSRINLYTPSRQAVVKQHTSVLLLRTPEGAGCGSEGGRVAASPSVDVRVHVGGTHPLLPC